MDLVRRIHNHELPVVRAVIRRIRRLRIEQRQLRACLFLRVTGTYQALQAEFREVRAEVLCKIGALRIVARTKYSLCAKYVRIEAQIRAHLRIDVIHKSVKLVVFDEFCFAQILVSSHQKGRSSDQPSDAPAVLLPACVFSSAAGTSGV